MSSMPHDPNLPDATHAIEIILINRMDTVEVQIPTETIEAVGKPTGKTFSCVFSLGTGLVPASPHLRSPSTIFFYLHQLLCQRNIWYNLTDLTLVCNKIHALANIKDTALADNTDE